MQQEPEAQHADYGSSPTGLPGDRIWPILVEGVVKELRPKTVLELGCGPHPKSTFYGSAIAGSLPEAGRYIAVDRDEAALDDHKRRLGQELADRVSYVQGEFPSVCEGLPGPFDLVITRCFVCLFFNETCEAVARKVASLGRYWLGYDSFWTRTAAQHDDWGTPINKLLHQIGKVYFAVPGKLLGEPPWLRMFMLESAVE